MREIKAFKMGKVAYSLKKADEDYYYLYANDNMICAYIRQIVEEDGKEYSKFESTKLESRKEFETAKIAIKRCQRYFDAKSKKQNRA